MLLPSLKRTTVAASCDSDALERGSAESTILPAIGDNVLDDDELVEPHLPRCSNRRLCHAKSKNDQRDKTDITATAHCTRKDLDAYGQSGMLKATLLPIDKTTFLEPLFHLKIANL